jgi:hypothetical protein
MIGPVGWLVVAAHCGASTPAALKMETLKGLYRIADPRQLDTASSVRPAVAKVAALKGPHTSKDAAFVQAVAEQNAKDAAALLLSRSAVLRELASTGKLTVASAMHDLATGAVKWLA